MWNCRGFSAARSAIPNYLLAKVAAGYVKVMLTGEVADEVYAGYDYLARFDSPEVLQDEMLQITNALHDTDLQRADHMPKALLRRTLAADLSAEIADRPKVKFSKERKR